MQWFIQYICLVPPRVFIPFFLLYLSPWTIHQSFSQEFNTAFKKTIDSLITAAPRTYQEIDAVLRPARKDTVLMDYFAKRSRGKKYLDGQAYALNQLGRSYRDISEFSRSLALHQRALEVAQEAKNLEFEVYSLNMISVIFRKTDAIKSALDYSQKALVLAESVENPSVGLKRSMNVSSNSIGNIYQILGQYDLAIDQFKKSVVIDLGLENRLGLAINYQNIGECYEAQGKLEEALKSFDRSLRYNDEIDSDRGRVICKYSIAHVYVHQGKAPKALNLLETILPMAERLGDQSIISSVYTNLGWTLMHVDRYDDSDFYLQKGLEVAKKFNLPSGISEAYKFLSDLWEERGDFKKAFEYYRLWKHYQNEISNDRNLRYVNDMIVRYEAEKNTNRLELLAMENENVKLKLRKNETLILISGIALALLAGIFYILYRQYQLKNEKKVLTLEQSMLRSQMNPHFLFNSLNSIKLYIINNEQKNAVHYLNKFSKLVRKILEASSLKEIPLEEELETVELYMNIEDIRFSNEIDFSIAVEDGIDPQQVKIPSLILQPFLENALWHGLSSKEGPKKIDLRVRRDGDGFIAIEITDNGVGREAAEKIKEGRVLKRKSVGIDITKERLANFSKDFQNSFEVDIVDLYDDGGKPSGTKVILRIPTI
ncbi:tetratricopeptide repeat protein [Flavobacteriaceae bacterium TP-CH-4]|uniref:Tetratricopeptide repeat protein n=1 Tax=Pelagihabitans pacificus TaxID=2696054 RepID=A0A967AWJ4_9FLAO|nr:tetratricopeptide repeat protein [Pelagihabitans pacificus]NHF60448.1 tetratricopeptide repeat protein [Pelagihabitans pacificus]